ncbi:MAG: transposase [Acidobacteria bacterium]|nr:transposase [Acidobacteriota bacterium]MBS1867130.1 transposase [Acidobacteriota bacterium]
MKDSKHKNIRLASRNYVGNGWYFTTICCAGRGRIFSSLSSCRWFLRHLQNVAASRQFLIHAYCIMPDHVHLLAQGMDACSDFLNFMKTLKIKTNREFTKDSGSELWQKKYYDHILRPGESVDRVAWYIWMNPVRAGLAAGVGEYAFAGSLSGMVPSASVIGKDWLPPFRLRARPPQKAAAT